MVNLENGQSDRLAVDDRGRLRLFKGNDGYDSTGEFVSTSIDVGVAGKKQIDWIPQWTAPQKWVKYEGNPIYGPRHSGAWDGWTNGVAVVRNPDNKTYKMYYSGNRGAGIGFAEGAIDNPLRWREHPASPVLKPLQNWEGNIINQPRVVKVTDTHWRMYYTGWGYEHPNGGSKWAFNLAESFDSGVTWKRHSEGPMLERGDVKSPDGGGVFVPEVRKIGDRWMMWYSAMKIAGGTRIHLCLATSEDGINWTKHPENPVLTDDFSRGPARNVTSRCFVRYDAGVYQMWYSHARPSYRIKYAESLDGVHWELSPISPVLNKGRHPSFDSEKVEYPEVDVVDGQWRLWFCGNGYGKVGFATGEVETAVKVDYRTGASAQPDNGWTPWKTATRGADVGLQKYVQIRIQLSSKNPQLSPALSRLMISGD